MLGIAGFFLVILGLIATGVFWAKPKEVPQENVFNAPKVMINFDILKEEKVTKLEMLPEIEKEFDYKGYTKKRELQTGILTSSSSDAAIKTLTDRGLSSVTVVEITQGRSNPFVPFYQIKVKAKSKTTKK